MLGLAVAVPAIVVATIAGVVQPASACHPEIQAKADCKGVVTFSASAWQGSSANAVNRTNNKIDILYSTTGSSGGFQSITNGTAKTATMDYAFNAKNGFKFADTFQLPDSVNRPADIYIQAKALVKWGPSQNIDVANQTAVVKVSVPAACSQPSATIVGPDCKVASAKVTLANIGTMPSTFSFHKDGATTAFESHTVAGNKTEVITVPVTTAFKLSVHVPGKANVELQLSPPVDCSKPSAVITKSCKADGSGWNLAFTNGGKVDEEFTVVSAGKTLDTVKLAAGKSVTKSYSFASANVAAGKSITLDVKAGDKVVKSETVTNDCINVTADISTTCDATTGSGAVLVFTNPGKVSETFDVTRDGKAVQGSPVVVAPSTTATRKLLPLKEDETAKISITGRTSGLKVEKTVTLDCTQVLPSTTVAPTTVPPTTAPPTQVLGETITRPPTSNLAVTGANVMPMAALGALLLLIGVGVLQLRRRQQVG